MSSQSHLTFSQTINVPPTAVYYAFTHPLPLTEWLCHQAQVDARIGGRLYLVWNQGYHASGEFTDLEANQLIAFSWHGRGETAVTQVDILLKEVENGTEVSLTHSGLGTGEVWDDARDEFAKGWQRSLDNLKAVLETGLDRRIYDRPFLGILLSGVLTAEQATAQGIAAEGGLQISGTMPDTGAAAAGLVSGDVITALGGVPTPDFPSLNLAVAPHKAGDTATVTLYRQGEVQTVPMLLSQRPVPEVPGTVPQLATALRDVYDTLLNELDEVMRGVTPETAVRSVTPDSWNSHQIIAHLITGERFLQTLITSTLEGQVLSGLAGNVPAAIDAITIVYPKTADLINAFKEAMAETVALVAGLPPELAERKASYLNLGNNLLFGSPGHTRTHFREIEQALAE